MESNKSRKKSRRGIIRGIGAGVLLTTGITATSGQVAALSGKRESPDWYQKKIEDEIRSSHKNILCQKNKEN